MFNAGALASLGPVSNGVTGLKYGVPRIVAALVKSLFTQASTRYLEALAAYGEPHFNPRNDEERAADVKPADVEAKEMKAWA
jgi:hypothetical protein